MSLNLEVQILGEYKNLTKATRGATNQLKGLQNSARGISRSINATLATIGVGLSFNALKNAIGSTISNASNLEESINAVQVSFGAAGDAVLKIGENSASAFGIARSEFNAAAVTFSAFADDVVGPGGDVADFIETLTQRGADFASVMNIDVAEALRVFRSGLSGETEPLKRFGIILNETAVKQFALESGLIETSRELTNQEKVLARYQLLLQETAQTEGDFANTKESLANGLRTLRSEFKDISAEIGDGFNVVLAGVVTYINQNIETFQELGEAIGDKLKSAFEDSGDSIEAFGAKVIRTIQDLTDFLNGTAQADNAFVKLNNSIGPILEVLNAFSELGKGVIQVLNGIFDGLFGWIKLIPGVDSSLSGFAGFIKNIGLFLQDFGRSLGLIGSLFIPFTAGFKIAGRAVGIFSNTLSKLGNAIKPVTNFFKNIFNKQVANSTTRVKELNVAQEALAKGMPNVATNTGKSVEEILKLSNGVNVAKNNVKVWDKYLSNSTSNLKNLNKYTGYARTEIGALDGAIRNLKDKTVNIRVNITGAEDRRFAALKPEKIDYNARAREYGEALRKSLIEPIEEETPETTGLTTFQKNVQKLIDTLSDSLTDAKNRIKGASENFRDSVSLAFGVITNGAFAVFDINRVLRQMRRLVDGAKNFAKDIKQLQKQGADQSLIDQLLGMDPLSGAATARGLLSSGRLQEFLDVRGQLSSIGAGAGGVANFGIYGTGTGGLSTAIESLTRTLERGYGNTYTINVNNANKMSGQEIVAAIKRYEKTTGRAVL